MIMVPAGVPEDRMKILADAAEKAIRSDTVKNYYEKYGSTLLLVKGDAATDFIKAEIDHRDRPSRPAFRPRGPRHLVAPGIGVLGPSVAQHDRVSPVLPTGLEDLEMDVAQRNARGGGEIGGSGHGGVSFACRLGERLDQNGSRT